MAAILLHKAAAALQAAVQGVYPVHWTALAVGAVSCLYICIDFALWCLRTSRVAAPPAVVAAAAAALGESDSLLQAQAPTAYGKDAAVRDAQGSSASGYGSANNAPAVSSQNHEGRQQAQGEQPDDTQGSTASNGNNPGGDGETNGGSALGDANGGSNNDSNGAAPCKYERRRRSSSASDIHYHVVPAGEVCRLVPHNPSAAAAALPAAAGAAKPVVIVRLQCSPPALVQRSAASTLVRARLLSSAAALAAALALARAAAAAPPPWHLAAAARAAALLGLGCALSPYLLRSSRYRRDPRLRCRLGRRDVRRRLRDPLVWTSLVYAVPALYGVAAHQYGVAALQAATTVGSTLFHRARETRYFNLDNVGALALLFTTAWSLALAARARVWAHAAVVLAGTPLAGYFMVACGMPGVVCACPSGDGTLRRASNPLYDHYHMLWHLVSGFGTIASIHFFASRYPHLDAGGGHFEHFPDVPVVPFVSLLLSAAVNVYGNWAGALPLS